MEAANSVTPTMTTTSIHTNVMRRVRTIYAVRKAASGTTLSIAALAVSLYFIGREVWVARIWENAPSLAHLDAFARFVTYAFTHTDISVQAFFVISIFALVWLAREVARVISALRPKLSIA